MKLYYMPHSCALAAQIVAHEAGIEVEAVRVDFATKTTERGGDYLAVNPKGYVPALELDDGQVLTEGPAILQYLADLAPAAGLAPPPGALARVRLQEALNYLASDVHRAYGPLFDPATPAGVRDERCAYLRTRYAILDAQLAGRRGLVGDAFTVADAYLFVVNRWADMVGLDISGFPNVQAFQAAVAARPAVHAAMQAHRLTAEAAEPVPA